MSDIDSSLILKRDRRAAELDSNADDNTTVEDSSEKLNCEDGDPSSTARDQKSQSPKTKKAKHSDQEVDEEEAEF